MRFSVIVPVYGVEQWVGDCVRSIAGQDFPQSEFEVICVDDFSPDRSGEIVSALTREYPNVKLLRHSENKRQGGARNTAMDVARGEWVLFVDSDDKWFRKDVLRQFGRLIDQLGAGVNIIKGINRTGGSISHKDAEICDIVTGEEHMASDEYDCNIWTGCYRLENIRRKGLRFRERAAYEDTDWTFRLYQGEKRVCLANFAFYQYQIREGSTANSASIKVLNDNIEATLLHHDLIVESAMGDAAKRRCMRRVLKSVKSFVKFSKEYPPRQSVKSMRLFNRTALTLPQTYGEISRNDRLTLAMLRYSPLVLTAAVYCGVRGRRIVRKILGR